MSVQYDFRDTVYIVTGVCGALGSAVAERFSDAGATVAGIDIIEPSDEDALIDPGVIEYYQADLTAEQTVSDVVDKIGTDIGQINGLCNIAGTWKGGQPIEKTAVSEFELLVDINLKSMFLMSKHTLPYLKEQNGTIVSVSAKSSLEGGEGDGPYRAAKAGVRILTETIATENVGSVRANAILPSVIDTPMNREMMPDADHDSWVDPDDIASVILFLCSDASSVTSGASVPVYGES